MICVRKKEDVEPAFTLYYSKLAEFMVQLVDIGDKNVILEPGCGHGRLTASLLPLIAYSKYICYDLYSGVYEKSLQKILRRNLETVIIVGDVRDLSLHTESVDLIVSNELLCELTRNDTRKAVKEFYRVLKKGGTFIHGVLSPYPENEAQELVIESDKYSAEPLFEREWFSPPADELAGILHRAGFSRICVAYFEETIKFEGDTAFEQVKSWITRPEFFEKYSDDLEEYGLEYPVEQIVNCTKLNLKAG